MSKSSASRNSNYMVVEVNPRRTRIQIIICVVAWILSIVGAWLLATKLATPNYTQLKNKSDIYQNEIANYKAQIKQFTQKEILLKRSEQISQDANKELQTSLVEREEEIAGLRADVAFYEQLVGDTQQRKGLTAHSAVFSSLPNGAWQFNIVLTQTLIRGAISSGQMRFSIEGLIDGKLKTLYWEDFHQVDKNKKVPGVIFSFRYFQQLQGNIMLPKNFTPQRVKVQLSSTSGNAEQLFDWKTTQPSSSKNAGE